MTNSNSIAAACNQRIEGLKKHVTAKTEILINGESSSLAQTIAIYQGSLDARSALKAARNQAEVALQEWNAAEATRSSMDAGLKQWVFAKFGPSSQEAKDMGFTPRKVGKKSVATKNGAVEQSAATREARHTMGKKQKARIKGTVVVPTAPAAPATSEAPVAQAAAASQPVVAAVPSNGAAAVAANGAAH
jgi:hypothetical protein